MKNIIILFGGFILSSCLNVRKVEYSSEMIIGRWCSISTMADYPHLTFRQDGYVTVDCKIDTIFGLKYRLTKDHLFLTNEKFITEKDRILKLSSDTLIFKSLIKNKTQQVYLRCR